MCGIYHVTIERKPPARKFTLYLGSYLASKREREDNKKMCLGLVRDLNSLGIVSRTVGYHCPSYTSNNFHSDSTLQRILCTWRSNVFHSIHWLICTSRRSVRGRGS